jgi:small subunit ribosomal protein S6e
MKQGVLTNQRVKLLLKKGSSCYRIRKRGERKKKSVRGCIVSSELSVLNLVIVKKGPGEIPGLTDKPVEPRRKGPKRASNIIKLFALDKKKDNVRDYAVRREIKAKVEGKRSSFKQPKIQRLVTPARLQNKRDNKRFKRERTEATRQLAEEYNVLLAKRTKEAQDARQAAKAKRKKSSLHASTRQSTTAQ